MNMNISSLPPPPSSSHATSVIVAKNSPNSNPAINNLTTPISEADRVPLHYDYLTVWPNSTSNDDMRNKKEIDEFRAALQPTFHAHPDQELVREAMMLDSACLRFLRARRFVIDKAVQHFKRALQLRVQQHIDAVLLSPFTNAASFNRVLCRGFHGYDRMGRPIYVERIGCIDVDTINTAMTLQQRLAFCRYQAEYIRKIEFPRASARLGKRIDQVVILVDMRGFNRHHIRPSQYTFIHALTSNDSLLYPERLAYTVLINVPTVFSLVWRVVSTWMDAQMRAKFFLFSTDEADKARIELTRRIDPTMLPACMGGTCKCGSISLPPAPHKPHESSTTLGVVDSAHAGTTNSVSTISASSSELSTSTTAAAPSIQSSVSSAPSSADPTAAADVVSFYAARATSASPPTTLTTTAASSPPTVTPTSTNATASTMTTPTPPVSSPPTSSTSPTRAQSAAGRTPAPMAVAVAGDGSGRRGSAPVAAASPATSLLSTATTNKGVKASSGFFSTSKSSTSSASSSPPQKRSGGGSSTSPVSAQASAYRWDPDYCLTNSRENRQFLEFCQHGMGIHTSEQAALAAAAANATDQAPTVAPGEQISHEDETRIAASVEHAEQMEKQSHPTTH